MPPCSRWVAPTSEASAVPEAPRPRQTRFPTRSRPRRSQQRRTRPRGPPAQEPVLPARRAFACAGTRSTCEAGAFACPARAAACSPCCSSSGAGHRRHVLDRLADPLDRDRDFCGVATPCHRSSSLRGRAAQKRGLRRVPRRARHHGLAQGQDQRHQAADRGRARTFPTPIPPPDHSDMPAALDTCENCHGVTRDAVKTLKTRPSSRRPGQHPPVRGLMIRPGGGNPFDVSRSVHWHVLRTVTFWSTDPGPDHRLRGGDAGGRLDRHVHLPGQGQGHLRRQARHRGPEGRGQVDGDELLRLPQPCRSRHRNPRVGLDAAMVAGAVDRRCRTSSARACGSCGPATGRRRRRCRADKLPSSTG